MAKILPFKGVLYNREKVKGFKSVVSPPYDVISHAMKEELYKASPYNIVRIILGKHSPDDNKSDNQYTRAARFLEEWLRSGVLKKDTKPAIYVYEQEYLHKGKPKKRMGFISLMRIEDPGKNLVLPHEYTFAKPKEDRLNLIRATGANTEPIFCIFQDNGNRVTNAIRGRGYAKKSKPVINIRLEGIRNRIWRLADQDIIRKIQKALDKKQVFIADGHHRYEVSLAFRDEMRKKLGLKDAGEFENLMVYFSSLTDDNLTILSTYRVIKNAGGMDWKTIELKLQPYFRIEEAKTKKAMFDALEMVKTGYTFGMYFKNGKFYVLKLKNEAVLDKVIKEDKSREWRRLNVTVLHYLVLGHILHVDKSSSNDENILYTRDEDDAIGQVKSGKCEMAFFQVPTKMIQVRNIAAHGDRMPHKSTYFYPKPLSGLVLNKF
ncbi:MAG: DUF1015 domain-containing protein [Candidatus Omnitrophota bacterium]|nr:DUF1015 domain-containing protein [Candidatus Omnitrophota bacterium]